MGLFLEELLPTEFRLAAASSLPRELLLILSEDTDGLLSPEMYLVQTSG